MKSEKRCSICGETYPIAEFSYGNRDNRSYCRVCNREEKKAYSQGGRESAKLYRDQKRKEWQ